MFVRRFRPLSKVYRTFSKDINEMQQKFEQMAKQQNTAKFDTKVEEEIKVTD